MDNSPTETSLDKGVIHIIDDEQDIVTIASKDLEINSYSVHSFTNADEALADIELKCRKKVRMLITDIHMPVHNGFEVARRTRAIVPTVPIIFMTAFEVNSLEFKDMFPSLDGKNEFLQKPFHVHTLLELVQKYDSS